MQQRVRQQVGGVAASAERVRDPEHLDGTSERRDPASERREATSRSVLVERFRAEFREMPGLWVTRPEARRLFGVPEDTCQRVLDMLVAEGALIRTRSGIYRTPPAIGGRRD
jgi:hypothetical protein